MIFRYIANFYSGRNTFSLYRCHRCLLYRLLCCHPRHCRLCCKYISHQYYRTKTCHIFLPHKTASIPFNLFLFYQIEFYV